MATPNSTNGSCACAVEAPTHTARLLTGCDLDLPDAPAFHPRPPRLGLTEMVRLSEALRPLTRCDSSVADRRLGTKAPEEFVL
jgi:hypothetical protein